MAIDKLAFVHTAKAAGRYINRYLISRVFGNRSGELATQGVKVFNSWYRPFLLARDWSEEELLQIAAGRHPAQYPTPDEVMRHHCRFEHDYLARQFVHNHNRFWTPASITAFQQRDWMVFTFLRDPAERLCSLWTWTRAEAAAGTDPRTLLTPTWLIELSLDGFIREALGNPERRHAYALPDYIGQLDFVAGFNDANFADFLQTAFGHDYAPESIPTRFRRASGNPGYAAYRERGAISDQTDDLLNNNAEVRRVRQLLAGPPRVSPRYTAMAAAAGEQRSACADIEPGG